MNDQIVTFETALLAKEKGFGWKCLDVYNIETKQLYDRYFIDFEAAKNQTDLRGMMEVGQEDVNYDRVVAPTQSLLQKWLREKFKIQITPFYYGSDSHYQIAVGRNSSSSNSFAKNEKHYCFTSDSYEKILEIGLQTALKMINL